VAQVFYASRLPASWQARLSEAGFYYGLVAAEPTNVMLITGFRRKSGFGAEKTGFRRTGRFF
jgi:hypothetical protein